MTCPRCHGTLATISIDLVGNPLTMGSCNVCRTRHWLRDGRPFDLRGELVPAKG